MATRKRTSTPPEKEATSSPTLAPPVAKDLAPEVLAALDITDTSGNPPASLDGRDPEFLKKLYEGVVRARAFEDRMHSMYRAGDLLGSYYSGNWHEAISVGTMAAMTPEDYFAPLHRDVGAHLMRGMPPEEIMGSFMGKAIAPTGGRDGTLHYGRLDLNTYNPPSHIPANYPVATGMAFAAKYRGDDRVAVAICGDGSTSRADFHEAVNIAGAMQLPIVFQVQNNQIAMGTKLSMQTHSSSFAIKAVAYGIPGIKCDGTDVVAVYDAMKEAVDRARAGGGPTLVEAVTMRMHGHAEHDSADYVDPALIEEWGKRDPVELFEKRLLDAKIITDEEATAAREDARKWAIAARKIAVSAPMPDPSNIEEGVYAN
ncbi:thiamine pyrophosphate-dependent dehydrogenase E1 component subunit alpha [Granulicoccus sp. GXG6511]|uniref:thiamine pyrophosphate-dependent dehydrogenase E1 component subunit alpha n=1 Tax=Granulicoccus sp. GXG6511 TaxID=3381351 RepID=UPI003D7EC3A0